MKKEDAVHIYNRILLSHIKEWNKAICSNVNAPRGLSHWLKEVREKQISYDSPYMWNPKNTLQMKLFTESDVEDKLI